MSSQSPTSHSIIIFEPTAASPDHPLSEKPVDISTDFPSLGLQTEQQKACSISACFTTANVSYNQLLLLVTDLLICIRPATSFVRSRPECPHLDYLNCHDCLDGPLPLRPRQLQLTTDLHLFDTARLFHSLL